MTDTEAIKIAEEEINRISYLLDCSPRIYDNPGMRKIYERKHEWLVQLLAIAKGAIEGYDPGWIPYTDPPKSDGRHEVAMKDGSLTKNAQFIAELANRLAKDVQAHENNRVGKR